MFFFLINFLFQKLSNLGRRHMDIIMAKTSLIIVHNVSVWNWKWICITKKKCFSFLLIVKVVVVVVQWSFYDWISVRLIDWLINEKKRKENNNYYRLFMNFEQQKKTLFVWMQMCVVCLFPSKLPLQHFNHHHHYSEWMNK